MAKFIDVANNLNDLQHQMERMKSDLESLLENQALLLSCIKRLETVKIKELINEVIKQLVSPQNNEVISFDDLLILNAKIQINKRFKSV